MSSLYASQRVPATYEAVRETRSIIEKIFVAISLDAQVKNRVIIATSELLNNIAEHGDANYFGINLGKKGQSLTIKISDDGNPWQEAQYENADLDSELAEEEIDDAEAILAGFMDEAVSIENTALKENGRGMAIIRSSADEYMHTLLEKGNQYGLTFIIPTKESKPRVLIVDDDLSQVELYRLFLSEEYAVTTARSFESALDQVSQNSFDLIVSDINMPGKDGFALREKVMSAAEYELIPFVFISGDRAFEKRERAVGLAVDDFIIKPIDKSGLLAAVKRVLNRSAYVTKLVSEKIDRKITQALFPTIPKKLGAWQLSMAVRNIQQGGGDIVLWNTIKDANVILLGDVMGHDITSKFFAFAHAGYLRGMLKSLSNEDECEDFLYQLNNAAITDKVFEMSPLTVLMMSLDEKGVKLSSAGAPSPLKITPLGVQPIDIGGMLLGLLPDYQYDACQIALASGERLAVYTDGLFDSAATPESRTLLENEIKQTLLETLSDPLETAILKVMNVFDSLSSTKHLDDTLLILIEPDASN